MAEFNFQPIVQQYTPPPIAEFDAYGQTLNQRYEENLASMDALEVFASQIETLQGSRKYKDQAIQDIRNIVAETHKTGDYERAAPKIRLMAKRLATDKNLQTAMQNFQNAKQWDEELRKARLSGQTMLQFGDYRTERFDEEGNLISNLPSFGNEKRLDWEQRQDSYFDKLQPSSFKLEDTGYSYNSSTGNWEKTTEGRIDAGITAERVIEQAKLNTATYLQSPEGQQQLKYLTSSRYGNMSREEAVNLIQQNLITTGMERVFSDQAKVNSATPIGDPRLDDQMKRLQMANISQQMRLRELEAKASNPENTSLASVYETEYIDKGSKRTFTEVASDLRSSDAAKRNVSMDIITRNLNQAAKGTGEAAEQSKRMLTLIDGAKKRFPTSYHTFIADAIEHGSGSGPFDSGNRVNATYGKLLSNSELFRNLDRENKGQAQTLAKLVSDVVPTSVSARSNIQLTGMTPITQGIISAISSGNRTPMEEAFYKAGSSYEVDFMRPNSIVLGQMDKGSSTWKLFTDPSVNLPKEYKLLKGDEKAFEKGNLTLVGVSAGKYPGAKNQVAQLMDKEGNLFIAEPNHSDKFTEFNMFMQQPMMQTVHRITSNPEIAYTNINHIKNLKNTPENRNRRLEAGAVLTQYAAALSTALNLPEIDARAYNRLKTPSYGYAVNPDEVLKMIEKISSY